MFLRVQEPFIAIRANRLGLRDGETTIWAGGGLRISEGSATCNTRTFPNRVGGLTMITDNPF